MYLTSYEGSIDSTPTFFAGVVAVTLVLVAGAMALVWRSTYVRQRSRDDYVHHRISGLEDRVDRLGALMDADDEIVIREARAAGKE